MVVDRDRIVGMPSGGVIVPTPRHAPTVVGQQRRGHTGRPCHPPPDRHRPVGPTAPGAGGTTAARRHTTATPSTLPSPDATTSTVSAVPLDGYADPSVVPDSPCPGAAGRVLDTPSEATPTLDPLEMSLPFAATGDYATACNAIEAGSVPDPFLSSATFPPSPWS